MDVLWPGEVFEDTQIELSGRSFEGAQFNYHGDLALSWQLCRNQVLYLTSRCKITRFCSGLRLVKQSQFVWWFSGTSGVAAIPQL